MMAMAGGKLVVQNTVDMDKSDASNVKKIVMQIGNNDPMEMKIEGAQQQKQFQKPNPKAFVKDETIKVAAGTFKTKHYRDKTAQGDTYDFWTSTDVPPFGIVKIEAEQKGGAGPARGPVKLELAALGKDAKPLITKPAKPMDQAAMMRQMMGGAGAGAGAGAGGPPPGGAKAPAPAAPPK